VTKDWHYVERPEFSNPQRNILELAEESLRQIAELLEGEERPWPLERQLEGQRAAIEGSEVYLGKNDHQVAYIGEVGVWKTTAISCVYSLLDPTSPASDLRERVVVLCSTFNQAPSTPVQLLLDHLRNAHGVRVDAGKVSVLVLPRDDEAMAVKDDSGETPIDDDDGCQLKYDQILRTQASGDGALNGLLMLFFNAKEDDTPPEDIRPGNVVRFTRREAA
jgi:hypothetical protein